MMAHDFGEDTTSEEVLEVLGDSIRGKNVLLVGATFKSLGGEFLRAVAPFAKTIWVVGRSSSKLQIAVDEALKPITGDNKPAVRLVEMDVTNFDSIRKAAEAINSKGEPIDVLLQNATIPWYPEIHRTTSGYEEQFTGNHLGPVLFTHLLLPRLRQAGPGARVVIVASAGYAFAPTRWDDPNYLKRPEEYQAQGPYQLSKLANILFVRELAKRLAPEGILAYTLHPGTVLTNASLGFAREKLIKRGMMKEDGTPADNPPMTIKTLSQGAATYIVAAFDPAIKDKSGAYLSDCQVVPEDKMAPTINDENTKAVWSLTEELLGIKLLE